ncbi:hypothetical protein AB0K48_23865, partial [Nonomuraea sp. NPDC055795]
GRPCRTGRFHEQGGQRAVGRTESRGAHVGRVGTWVYAIRYSDHPQEFARPIHAQDVVLMRVGQAVTLVVSDGYFGTFDPALSRRAARLAAAKLKEAQG